MRVQLDEDGRFESSVRGPGPGWLTFSRREPDGGGWAVMHPVELVGGMNEHDVAFSTGSVSLSKLSPSAENHPEVPLAGYALVQVAPDGSYWTRTFNPGAEGVWSGVGHPCRSGRTTTPPRHGLLRPPRVETRR